MDNSDEKPAAAKCNDRLPEVPCTVSKLHGRSEERIKSINAKAEGCVSSNLQFLFSWDENRNGCNEIVV